MYFNLWQCLIVMKERFGKQSCWEEDKALSCCASPKSNICSNSSQVLIFRYCNIGKLITTVVEKMVFNFGHSSSQILRRFWKLRKSVGPFHMKLSSGKFNNVSQVISKFRGSGCVVPPSSPIWNLKIPFILRSLNHRLLNLRKTLSWGLDNGSSSNCFNVLLIDHSISFSCVYTTQFIVNTLHFIIQRNQVYLTNTYFVFFVFHCFDIINVGVRRLLLNGSEYKS